MSQKKAVCSDPHAGRRFESPDLGAVSPRLHVPVEGNPIHSNADCPVRSLRSFGLHPLHDQPSPVLAQTSDRLHDFSSMHS
jgi:hypothetical protein